MLLPTFVWCDGAYLLELLVMIRGPLEVSFGLEERPQCVHGVGNVG